MEEYTQLLNEQIFAINTVWVALCAALIFFMEAGFALLEAGFVRAKNAMSIIAKVIIDITFGGIAFFVVGFGIAYGASNGWFALDFGIMEGDLGLDLTVSNQLFWFIQLGFAVAAISIVSGALAERMKLWAYAIMVVFFAASCIPWLLIGFGIPMDGWPSEVLMILLVRQPFMLWEDFRLWLRPLFWDRGSENIQRRELPILYRDIIYLWPPWAHSFFGLDGLGLIRVPLWVPWGIGS